jgi:hypothetical protein
VAGFGGYALMPDVLHLLRNVRARMRRAAFDVFYADLQQRSD